MEARTSLFRFVWSFFTFLFILFSPVLGAHAQGNGGVFLSPASGSFLIGSTFDVSILLDTKETSINTIEIELMFPPDRLQLANPSVGQSIIQVWPAPPQFSNRDGKIYFVGGIPSPGIVTSKGVVLTLTFRVVSPGRAELRFGDRTKILANDGKGTNILSQKPSAFYQLSIPPPQGPAISSPTHPDQDVWYRDPNPIFNWPKDPYSDGFSYSIDQDPAGSPDITVEGSDATAAFENLENGIWYFHLRERRGGVWGGVSHYGVRIDVEPPAEFRLTVSPGTRTNIRNPIFRFFTTDAHSGFDYFDMKIISLKNPTASDALFFQVTSPYQLTDLDVGRYQAVVRALDKAGNYREQSLTLDIASSFSIFSREGLYLFGFTINWSRMFLMVSAILILFVSIAIGLWIRHRHHVAHAFREDMGRLKSGFTR